MHELELWITSLPPELLVLVIGGGSPMNESDLLMTSVRSVLLLIGRYHNISPLN